MSKTIKEIWFDSLYPIYTVLHSINTLTADAEFSVMFRALLVKCADVLYNGDVTNITMHRALYNNLVSDKRSRYNNPETYSNGYLPDKAQRLALVDLLDSLLPREHRIVNKAIADTTTGKLSKSYWEYTEEDVLNVTDPAILDSVINNIGSAITRSTDRIAAERGVSAEEVKASLAAVRTVAREHKAKLTEPVISEKLAGKLNSGRHTTLSAAEVEELRKLLG